MAFKDVLKDHVNVVVEELAALIETGIITDIKKKSDHLELEINKDLFMAVYGETYEVEECPPRYEYRFIDIDFDGYKVRTFADGIFETPKKEEPANEIS